MEPLITLIGIILGLGLCLEYVTRKANKSNLPIYPKGGKNAQSYFRGLNGYHIGLPLPRNDSELVRGSVEQPSQPPTRPDPSTRLDPMSYLGVNPTWGVEHRDITYSPGLSMGHLQMRNENNDPKALMARWRRSIVGLMKMADRNLQAARQLLTAKDYPAAVRAACAGVENLSRALLHCYGDKPDLEPGQEEPLRLLSLKIKDAEKVNLEKIISDVSDIRKHSASPQISEATAQSAIESSSKIAMSLKQMIRTKCMMEISELQDTCPKCAATDVRTWCFNENVVVQECDICHYKWHELRTRSSQ